VNLSLTPIKIFWINIVRASDWKIKTNVSIYKTLLCVWLVDAMSRHFGDQKKLVTVQDNILTGLQSGCNISSTNRARPILLYIETNFSFFNRSLIILVGASLSHTLCASCWSVAWGGLPNVSCYALLSNMGDILQKLISEIGSVVPLA
jgi:hypothetical protein